MNAPLPPNERERLAALRRYAVLDTPPEAAFERITRLASRLLRVPIALVSLVDESRQWFKSSLGLPYRESGRDVSFCAHAILSNDVTEIVDARQDQRFADNPSVTGPPGIRFYAGAPLRTPDGFNLGTMCVIDTVPRVLTPEEGEILQDLAALVQDELELRLAVRERALHTAAVANLRSGVLVTDPGLPDNPIVFANPGFVALSGYTADELIGRNCRLLQGPESDRLTVAAIRDAIAERRPFHGEVLNYRKDGTPFWNELIINPVFAPDGELLNFVGLQTDVSGRKLAADQLRRNFERLQELEGLRDSLTHMIIHDLRSPLTVLLGDLEMLHSSAEGTLGPDDVEVIVEARGAAGALQHMITTLLDVSRLEAGEMPMRLREVDLRQVVAAASDPMVRVASPRAFRRELPATPVPVTCDPEIIQRVVTNLVGNAIKFTPGHGHVRVAIATEARRARVSVSDTGPGIPPEYHAKIFEKFGQVEGQRHQHSTGLGLTFCKLAIEAHRGRIGVDSATGQGSTFWFELEVSA